MITIGVLGGVASGKSLVTEQMRQLGAAALEADRIGHEVLRDPEVKAALRVRWGEAVFSPDGEIDRPTVARIVFAPRPHGPPELKFLEQQTHPKIGERLLAQLDALRRRGDVPAAVLDAPVLLKAGWDKMCDRIVFVDASREQRQTRARQRCWSDDDFAAREAAQESLETKRNRADLIVDNSGSIEATFAQVRQFWRSLETT